MGLTISCKSKKVVMKPEGAGKKNVDRANQDGNEVDYEEAVQRHYDMQSNRTKEMMSRTAKKRKMSNSGLNRQWYDQLFNNACLRHSDMVKTGHSYSTVTKRSSCFIKN